MQFFESRNVTNFNKLKVPTAEVSIPFNAGRRTRFRLSGAADPTSNVSLSE